VAALPMVPEVVDYVVDLVRATRSAPDLEGGASPRAAAFLAGAARARAALDGRGYVIPDDVKALAPAVLRHRVILSPAAEIEGRPVESVIGRLDRRGRGPR
jgi:MoxR-like ATPase